MQLKGKKGNARRWAVRRAQERAEGHLDRGWGVGAVTGREREGQRRNCHRILVRPLASFETFRKSPCLVLSSVKWGV